MPGIIGIYPTEDNCQPRNYTFQLRICCVFFVNFVVQSADLRLFTMFDQLFLCYLWGNDDLTAGDLLRTTHPHTHSADMLTYYPLLYEPVQPTVTQLVIEDEGIVGDGLGGTNV